MLIPLKLQWVKGGRNLPNVLINPPPLLSPNVFTLQVKKTKPNKKHTTVKCKTGKKAIQNAATRDAIFNVDKKNS